MAEETPAVAVELPIQRFVDLLIQVLQKIDFPIDAAVANIEALIAKLPPGAQPSAAEVWAAVTPLFGKEQLLNFKNLIVSELTELVTTGKSEPQHTFSDLA